jgi:hypothetical protein
MRFEYNSVQTRLTPRERKVMRVTVRGKKGYKSVEIRKKNGKTRRHKKALSTKEIRCIKKCQFIPGLFKDCIECVNRE